MKISKTRNVKTPTRAYDRAAGIDFYVPNDIGFYCTELYPGESLFIPSGIRAEIPSGYALIFENKSGWGKKGLMVGAKIVDEDYQGEMHINLWNVSSEIIHIKAGDKIVQAILTPVNYAKIELIHDGDIHTKETERANGGFGSTGIR